jgi:hypothetical protein
MRANKEIRPKKTKKKEEVQAWGFEDGKIPNYKDYVSKKPLTTEERELRKAFHEAMAALKEEEAKYGKKDFSSF